MSTATSITRTIAFLSCLAAGFAAPAAAATTEDEQLWVNLTVIGNVGHLAYFAEVQPRIGDGVSRLQQLLLRPAIGYRFSGDVSLYAGYVHVVLPRVGERDRNEERTFQQLSWTLGRIGGGTFSTRTRLEQRWLSNGHDTGWRLRSMARYVHPLGRPAQTRALVSIEPFVAFNDTDWGAHKGFDQVRTFVGLEIPLPGKSTIEAGYLNQAINDRGPVNRMNHVASLSLFLRP